jgi:cytochrome c5
MSLLRNSAMAWVFGAAVLAFAGSAAKAPESSAATPAVSATETNEQWMVEGEKRFRANCGRCHQSPHKFSPRIMSAVVRHMRVRAMLTDDDMKYVLYYVTH